MSNEKRTDVGEKMKTWGSAIALLGVVFSAGAFYAKFTTVEARQDKVEAVVSELNIDKRLTRIETILEERLPARK